MTTFFDRKLVLVVLAGILLPIPAIGAETGKLDKQQIVGQVAGDWAKIGIIQYQRGFYEQAKQSLLQARRHQEYLPAAERGELGRYLKKIDEVEIKKERVLAHIETADQLAGQGQVIKARAHLEKVINSPFLSQAERGKVSKNLAELAAQLNDRKKEIAKLYNRSVKLYQTGYLEKARQGFIKVAGSGLLAASAPVAPEDYLMKICKVSDRGVKSSVPIETGPAAGIPGAAVANTKELSPGVGQGPSVNGDRQMVGQLNSAAVFDTAQVVIDESRYVEAINRRRNIRQSYERALAKDSVAKAHRYISEGKFYKAKEAVDAAERTINKNRRHMGDKLVRRYKKELRQMTDQIEEGRTKWLGDGQAESGRDL